MTLDSATPQTLAPEQADLLRLLAYVYLQNRRFAQAVVLFQAIHQLDPHDAGICRSLACALLRDGQTGEALALLDDLRRSERYDALTELLSGQALARLGRADAAGAAMRNFVRLRAGASGHAAQRWTAFAGPAGRSAPGRGPAVDTHDATGT